MSDMAGTLPEHRSGAPSAHVTCTELGQELPVIAVPIDGALDALIELDLRREPEIVQLARVEELVRDLDEVVRLRDCLGLEGRAENALQRADDADDTLNVAVIRHRSS